MPRESGDIGDWKQDPDAWRARWNRLKRLSRVAANAAKNVVGHSEIRIERQRNVDLGLRPIEVPIECCGHRRDNSCQRFGRVLFDRLFSVSFGHRNILGICIQGDPGA